MNNFSKVKEFPTIEYLCETLKVNKRLFGTLDWRRVNQTQRISTVFEISGIIAQGLSFRMTCQPDILDEQVAIVLLTEVRRKPRAFARIDWRGKAHENRHALCGDLRFTDAGRTHFHDPELHGKVEITELFGGLVDLPIARAINPEPDSFEDLLEVAADMLYIENLTQVPVPPWLPRISFL